MRAIRTLAVALAVSAALGGCATWSTSNIDPGATSARPKSDPANVILTEGDITDRPYVSIGDVKVSVNKTTVFHPDPTRELAATKLREAAAELGADAVVHARFGTVGISLFSWGSLDASGRAVVFK